MIMLATIHLRLAAQQMAGDEVPSEEPMLKLLARVKAMMGQLKLVYAEALSPEDVAALNTVLPSCPGAAPGPYPTSSFC